MSDREIKSDYDAHNFIYDEILGTNWIQGGDKSKALEEQGPLTEARFCSCT